MTVIAMVSVLVACADQPIGHPMTFFSISPRFVCQGDDHQTVVRLDARQSSPVARLIIAGEAPEPGELTFQWSVNTTGFRVVEGNLTAPEISLTLSGDRPVTVRLTVTNLDGEQATDENTVGLTIPTASPCASDSDCTLNEKCVDFEGRPICLPARDGEAIECAADSDCPACYRCELSSNRCVP